MRTVQTFMLRLLVDPDEPGEMRGALHCVPGSTTLSFSGEEDLLKLLRRLAFGGEGENGSSHNSEQTSQNDPAVQRPIKP